MNKEHKSKRIRNIKYTHTHTHIYICMNISTVTFNNIGPVLMLKLNGWSGVFVILFLVSCVYFLISSFVFTNHSNGHQLAFLFLPTNVYFPLVPAGLSQHLLLPSRDVQASHLHRRHSLGSEDMLSTALYNGIRNDS